MRFKPITLSLLGLGLMAAPAFAAQSARPGTVNYIEGSASIDGQQINANQSGNVELDAGQELTTGKGKVEVLLTPGVFLRVDDNSAIRLVSPDLVNTQVQIERGRAGVEVDEIHKENNLQIIDAGVTTRLEKTGYYEFDANHPAVMVLKGKARVQLADGKSKEVKGHHALALAPNGQPMMNAKTEDFDKTPQQDELMNWSKLRSEYLAEANNQIAGDYAGDGYNPGWYGNPYGLGYTFIGGGPFYSPFGWGYYPLGWGGYGGWGGGFYGSGYYGHRPYYGGHIHQRGGFSHGGMQMHGGMSGGMHGGMHAGGHR